MDEKLIPDYEVKLLMEPSQVLEDNGKLNESVKDVFKIKHGSTKMSIQFMDTHDKVIRGSDWNLRIRKSEKDKDKFQVTYKKRFPIADSNFITDIDEQVTNAHNEGFHKASGFDAQVEVGYKKQTLSISFSDDVSASDYDYEGMDLPHVEHSRQMLAEKTPKSFEGWTESTPHKHLGDSEIYGPVDAKRYQGKWENNKLYIEVWPIRASQEDETLEPTVEASFKTTDVNQAMKGLRDLGNLLRDKGWLCEKDSLKTNIIMERYGPKPKKS